MKNVKKAKSGMHDQNYFALVNYNPGQNHLQHSIKTILCGFFLLLGWNTINSFPPLPYPWWG
jgi:hypothetical protein